jgi:hypothetical protein
VDGEVVNDLLGSIVGWGRGLVEIGSDHGNLGLSRIEILNVKARREAGRAIDLIERPNHAR